LSFIYPSGFQLNSSSKHQVHMHIIHGRPPLLDNPRVHAVTIGTFDGLHLGHQQIFTRLKQRAEELNAIPVALTFEPMPAEFFTPYHPPSRLTPLQEKLALIKSWGIDTGLLRFDQAFAQISADDFIHHLLCEKLQARYVIIGDDFRYGRNREGGPEHLHRLGAKWGFSVEHMPTYRLGDERISSSAVRQALSGGNMDKAASLLGRYYSLCGRIRHGLHLGMKMGFPTANIALQNHKPPIKGVFVVQIRTRELAWHWGVANIGKRPTVHGHDLVLEVHLLDFSSSLYGAKAQVRFLHSIRPELRFDSIEDLRLQIAQDINYSRAWIDQHRNRLNHEPTAI